MSIRKSEEYLGMDTLHAVMLAEGSEEGSEEEVLAAWQYLYDIKAYQWLQGWYGRTMRDMLDAGVLEARDD